MMILKFVICFYIGFAVLGLEQAHAGTDPIQELNKSFPGSLETKGKSIEFCPDNACDFFVGIKEVPFEEIKDFAYLYIFYFSDFYALNEWRGREESAIIIDEIFFKSQYQDCRKYKKKDAALCILHKLSQNGRIEVFAVRYDENVRNAEKVDLEKVLK